MAAFGNNKSSANNVRKSLENRMTKPVATAKQQQPPTPAVVPKVKGPSIPHKPKPKTIDAGLAQLNFAELSNMLATYKVSFVDSHLMWLKGVSDDLQKPPLPND